MHTRTSAHELFVLLLVGWTAAAMFVPPTHTKGRLTHRLSKSCPNHPLLRHIGS
jgi:hypothetical protein